MHWRLAAAAFRPIAVWDPMRTVTEPLGCLFVLGLVLLSNACASTAPQPGTGEVAFRVTWTGIADLDLYVRSPLGERVDFLNRQVDSGGILDVDCNAGTSVCSLPMENIFWPRRKAPPGRYKYWIVVANPAGLEPSDTYYLRAFARGEIVSERRGKLSELEKQAFTAWVEID